MANITVVGGGGSSYSVITLLTQGRHKISLLTSRPSEWSPRVECEIMRPGGGLLKTISGQLASITDQPKDVIPSADVIIICAPVHAYNRILEWIFPYLAGRHSEVFVGAAYGQGGFDWMVEAAASRHRPIPGLNYWAIGLLPWICRTKEYGRVGVNYGPKLNNIVATSTQGCYDYLSATVLDDLSVAEFGVGGFVRADSFISLTLSVDNQIIHPSRCYALYCSNPEGWKAFSNVPYFYRDFDDASADLLHALDEEYSLVRAGVAGRFPDHQFLHMMNYLDFDEYCYGRRSPDIKTSFRDSATLWDIKAPVVSSTDGYRIDFSHRFFLDDLYYGLHIGRWFAIKLGLLTPTLDAIIMWSEEAMTKYCLGCSDFRSGSPDYYGYEGVGDAIKFGSL